MKMWMKFSLKAILRCTICSAVLMLAPKAVRASIPQPWTIGVHVAVFTQGSHELVGEEEGDYFWVLFDPNNDWAEAGYLQMENDLSYYMSLYSDYGSDGWSHALSDPDFPTHDWTHIDGVNGSTISVYTYVPS